MSLSAAARAQEPQPQLSVTRVDTAAYPQVSLGVAVLDGTGTPVTGLTAQQFRAFEGDTPLAIDSLSVQRLDLGVAITIDVSGSMEGGPLQAAKDAAIEFTQTLAPGDTVTLLAFSDSVRTVVPPTTDKQAVIDGISGLQAVGGTALFDAAHTATYAASTIQAPRKAVVFLSDGENAAESPMTATEALDLAAALQVPVYAIGFGPVPDTSFLQQLANISSGRYAPANTGTVGEVYGNIAALLNTQYTLTVTAPPAADGAGGPASLRIEADIAGQPAATTASFERPGAIPEQTPVIQPVGNIDTASESGSSNSTLLLVLGGAGGLALLALLAAGAMVLARRTRTRQRQLAIVSGNLERAEEQGLPTPHAGSAVDTADGEGAVRSLGGVAGGPWRFATRPLRIGTAPECEIRVPWSSDVGLQHALIWMRDGKIMLRHIAGPAKKTIVGGRPVEWVILDSGEEVCVGPQRFVAELVA